MLLVLAKLLMQCSRKTLQHYGNLFLVYKVPNLQYMYISLNGVDIFVYVFADFTTGVNFKEMLMQ